MLNANGSFAMAAIAPLKRLPCHHDSVNGFCREIWCCNSERGHGRRCRDRMPAVGGSGPPHGLSDLSDLVGKEERKLEESGDTKAPPPVFPAGHKRDHCIRVRDCRSVRRGPAGTRPRRRPRLWKQAGCGSAGCGGRRGEHCGTSRVLRAWLRRKIGRVCAAPFSSTVRLSPQLPSL